jgi:hypothetical protein
MTGIIHVPSRDYTILTPAGISSLEITVSDRWPEKWDNYSDEARERYEQKVEEAKNNPKITDGDTLRVSEYHFQDGNLAVVLDQTSYLWHIATRNTESRDEALPSHLPGGGIHLTTPNDKANHFSINTLTFVVDKGRVDVLMGVKGKGVEIGSGQIQLLPAGGADIEDKGPLYTQLREGDEELFNQGQTLERAITWQFLNELTNQGSIPSKEVELLKKLHPEPQRMSGIEIYSKTFYNQILGLCGITSFWNTWLLGAMAIDSNIDEIQSIFDCSKDLQKDQNVLETERIVLLNLDPEDTSKSQKRIGRYIQNNFERLRPHAIAGLHFLSDNYQTIMGQIMETYKKRQTARSNLTLVK